MSQSVGSVTHDHTDSERQLEELQRLKSRLERRADELDALRKVGRALSSSLERDDVLHIILRAVTETLAFDMGTISLVDRRSGLIQGVLGINQAEELIDAIRRPLDGPDILSHVIRTGKVEVVDGWDPRLDRETFEKYGHHNYATIFGPITVSGERIGVLSASRQRSSHQPITPHDYALFTLFLDHAGLALQNAKILESERKKTRRLWAVNEVGRRASSLLNLDQLLAETTKLVREAFHYQHVSVLLLHPIRSHMLYRAAYSSEAPDPWPELWMEVGTGMTGWAALTTGTQLANDTSRDEHFVQAPGPHTGSELDVPLTVGDKVIGVLSIECETPDGFEEDDVPFVETLADQIAVAIHNSQVYQSTQRQAEQLRAINTVARQMSSLRTTQELLPFIVEVLRDTFHSYSVSIFLAEEGSDSVRLAAASGGRPGPMPVGTQLRIGEQGIVGAVAAAGDALVVNDVTSDRRYFPYPGLPETAAEVAVPIRCGSRVAGVLDVQSAHKDAFDDRDVSTLQTLADQMGIALENARLYEGLRRRSEQVLGLNEAGRAITTSLELDAILRAIILEVGGRLGFDRCGIALVDEAAQVIRGDLASDVEGRIGDWREFECPLRLDDDSLAEVALDGWVGMFRARAQARRLRRYLDQGVDPRASVALPLRVRGRPIGVLVVDNLVTERTIDDEGVEILRTFANQAAIAIDHARLYREAAERAERLAEANRQLSDLDRMKSHFISMVSHELRTPLGLIKGYVGTLLRDDLDLDLDSRREFLTVVEEEADNLADLVGNLLDASRLEAGTLAMELHPTRLTPLVKKAVHDATEHAPEYEFRFDAPQDIPLVNADGRRIQQVVRNLLDNAAKYSPPGSEIVVDIQVAGPWITVSVKDHGMGIAPDNLERVFDRFFRVDQTDSRRGGGSGLGLAIARGIVTNHGGKIWVESEIGGGSTFRFSLPIG